MPGSLPRVIRVDAPLLRRRGPRAPARLPGRGAGAARRPRVGTIGSTDGRSSSQSASAGSPPTRWPPGYDLGADVAMLASNESCFAPAPAVRRGRRTRRSAGVHRYPDPVLRSRCARRWPTATGSRAQRIALGNGSCDILLVAPARRCSSPGPRSSTRGRRSASTRTSPPPRARARSRSRSMPRTATTSTRWPPRSPSPRGWCSSATRTTRRRPRCGLDAIEAFLQRVPRHVRGDPRRGLLRVRAGPRGHLCLGRAAAPPPQPVLLRTFSKAYGLAGLRVGYGLCGSEDLRAAVDQVRQPFYLNAPAQAAAVAGAAPPGRGRAPGRPHRRRAHRAERRAARTGLWVAESDANFVWTHLPGPGCRGRDRQRSARARGARPGRLLAGAGRCAAGDDRDRGRERPVPRGDG